jgi:imidazolonepropionase
MLQETARPPIDALHAQGVPIALASDLNPGTSPVADLALVCNLGAVLFGLTPEEALAGVTRNGAAALGLADRGQLRPGLRADLAVWDVSHPAEIAYWAGMDLCSAAWVGGKRSFDRSA